MCLRVAGGRHQPGRRSVCPTSGQSPSGTSASCVAGGGYPQWRGYLGKLDANTEHNKAQKEWMAKLRKGDLSGVETPHAVFIPLPGKDPVKSRINPRITKEYKQSCLDICGLGTIPDEARYAHLTAQEKEALALIVKRVDLSTV